MQKAEKIYNEILEKHTKIVQLYDIEPKFSVYMTHRCFVECLNDPKHKDYIIFDPMTPEDVYKISNCPIYLVVDNSGNFEKHPEYKIVMDDYYE